MAFGKRHTGGTDKPIVPSKPRLKRVPMPPPPSAFTAFGGKLSYTLTFSVTF